MLQIFFIFTILNTFASLIFSAKIQPKISSGSGEEVYFVVFAIFKNSGHPGFFIFSILHTYVTLIFHAKIQLKISVVLEKKFMLLFLLFLETAAILDIRPNPI